jgi:hypothetical protein
MILSPVVGFHYLSDVRRVSSVIGTGTAVDVSAGKQKSPQAVRACGD